MTNPAEEPDKMLDANLLSGHHHIFLAVSASLKHLAAIQLKT